MGYMKQHLLIGMLRRNILQCLRLVHPQNSRKPQHRNGSCRYLQLKGTAHSQKFNIVTGDVFPSEKWAIQSSAGEKRWLKKKKEGEKKAKIVEMICVLVYHSCCIYPSAFKNIWDSILK